MTLTFVDTSFFLGLALVDDELHDRSIAWQRSITGRLITTAFVLTEVADDLSQPRIRSFASAIFTLVRTDPQFQVIPVSQERFEQGYRLFTSRPDKAWGLTDCISFEDMREMGITDALTHDHHFEQAGFRALLREEAPSN